MEVGRGSKHKKERGKPSQCFKTPSNQVNQPFILPVLTANKMEFLMFVTYDKRQEV